MSEQGPGYYDAAGEIYTQTEDPVNIRMRKEAEQKKAEEAAAKPDTTYGLKKEEIIQDDLSRPQTSATNEQSANQNQPTSLFRELTAKHFKSCYQF